ncbi:hypothetical protein [Endozoicomonas sp. ALD040]
MFAQVEKRFDQQDHKIEAYQSENCKHFDKIEETLAIIVNHLRK